MCRYFPKQMRLLLQLTTTMLPLGIEPMTLPFCCHHALLIKLQETDSLLILGEFIIHICCPDKPLVWDIFYYLLSLVDSFNLTQSVVDSLGTSTLDLVLSWGVPVCVLAIENKVLSDDFLIMFTVSLWACFGPWVSRQLCSLYKRSASL